MQFDFRGMIIQNNISLKNYNTFGIEAKASYFIQVTTIEELQEALAFQKSKGLELLVLGGGSNILLTKDFQGLVLKIDLKGINVVKEDDANIWIKAAAGEIWHQLVIHCVEHNWGGLENLSLIPGTVGAAPMQNIGAYGAEIKDTFVELQALEIASGNTRTFNQVDCDFGYRHSIFKTELKNKYIILFVTFNLHKHPQFKTSYGAIQQTLEEMGIKEPSIQSISQAVIKIRQSKLPDPAQIGNAGSFFKNPSIPIADYQHLKLQYPDMPGYVVSEAEIKVPAGWLIEQCGWKGKVIGQTGIHKNQALVLVNHGGAKGNDIWQLAMAVQESVKTKFNIEILPEVNVIR